MPLFRKVLATNSTSWVCLMLSRTGCAVAPTPRPVKGPWWWGGCPGWFWMLNFCDVVSPPPSSGIGEMPGVAAVRSRQVSDQCKPLPSFPPPGPAKGDAAIPWRLQPAAGGVAMERSWWRSMSMMNMDRGRNGVSGGSASQILRHQGGGHLPAGCWGRHIARPASAGSAELSYSNPRMRMGHGPSRLWLWILQPSPAPPPLTYVSDSPTESPRFPPPPERGGACSLAL